MPVVWTQWGLVAMIIFLVVSLTFAVTTFNAEHRRRDRLPDRARAAFLVFVAWMAAFNGVSVIATALVTSGAGVRDISPAELAGGMGIQSGKVYSVIVADPATANPAAGQFVLAPRSMGTSTPDKPVSFVYAVSSGTTCQINIPATSIDTKHESDVAPTFSMDIDNQVPYRDQRYQGAWVRGGLVLDTLHLAVYNDYDFSWALQFRGCQELSKAIDGHIVRATLTLSPSDYQKVRGA